MVNAFYSDGVVYGVGLVCKWMDDCIASLNGDLGILVYHHTHLDCCVAEGSHEMGNVVLPHKRLDRCIGVRNRDDHKKNVLEMVAYKLDDGYFQRILNLGIAFFVYDIRDGV